MGIKANTRVKKLSSFSIAEQKRVIATAIQNSMALNKTGPNEGGTAILEFGNNVQCHVEVWSSIDFERKKYWLGHVLFKVVHVHGMSPELIAARVVRGKDTAYPLLVFYRLINASFMNTTVGKMTGLYLPNEIVQVVEHYLKEVESGKA